MADYFQDALAWYVILTGSIYLFKILRSETFKKMQRNDRKNLVFLAKVLVAFIPVLRLFICAIFVISIFIPEEILLSHNINQDQK